MGSLKLFVKAVRKAKTIADERAVVRKESAAIRTSFRDPNLDQNTRRVNISKLLYLYILGEKTHFGQVECLKLLVSPRFSDKRLGYLATMLLLDENQEVLTLLTNLLDHDMQHPNTFIVGQALSCLGNIASPELARDLYANVDRIMANTSATYLRKKAVVVAAKLVEKEPDLGEVFGAKVPQFLADKTPLVLLGTCRLVLAVYLHCPDLRPLMVRTVPKLIAHLKRVLSLGYMPEYDVTGVTDPFLQVALLGTLRVLVCDPDCPPQYVEETNDVLTVVALSVDSGKNAAHAVLYECVKTIFAMRLDQLLKVLGVNLLGKFLVTKDNNTRYVALESLLVVMEHEPLAVQRHRATIVACLADGDVSIRRRALELVFAIVNDQNIRVLMREILKFLETCPDADLKPYITAQVTRAVFKYAPTEKWQFDTLVRMLRVCGACVTPDILSSVLALVMRTADAELKRHVVHKVLQATLEDPAQFGLAVVCVWTLGEYADLVVGSTVEVQGRSQTVAESTVVDVLDSVVANSCYSDAETDQLVAYALTAALKLLVKLSEPPAVERLRLLIAAHTHDKNLDIQTRAVEYQAIFGQDDKLKRGLLARMPAPPVREREALSLQGGTKPKLLTPVAAVSTTDDLLNLLDDIPAPSALPHTTDDLLSDIFGAQPQNQSVPVPVPALSDASAIEAFANGHLRITFAPTSFSAGQAVLETRITSTAPASAVDQVQLLIAVPKTQKLTISTTAGSDSLVSSNEIRQVLKIVGKAGTKVKLRVKVKYNVDGVTTEDQFDFGKIDQTL